LVMVTAPGFYLPIATPLQLPSDESEKHRAVSSSIAVRREGSPRDVLHNASKNFLSEGAAAEEKMVFDFAASSPATLWSLDARAIGADKQSYTKAPVAMRSFVDKNSSRNVDVRSMESAIFAACQDSSTSVASNSPANISEASQGSFLGSSQSPTHRTMLHISSARLPQAQGSVFAVLEETCAFPDPMLEVLFLHQLCALFLDPKKVFLDTNKLALAARTLCLIVLFCRKLLWRNLTTLCRGGSAAASSPALDISGSSASAPAFAHPGAHLEALIGAIPDVCQACMAFAGRGGGPDGRSSGLWMSALEALLYIAEDTLPALDLCDLGPGTTSAYWTAVVGCLAEAVAAPEPSDPVSSPIDFPSTADAELLAQAVGNLIAHRIISCKATPPKELDQAVQVLNGLISRQGSNTGAVGGEENDQLAQTGSQGTGGGAPATIGYLFELCACDVSSSSDGAARPTGAGNDLSICALSAKGGVFLRRSN